MIVLKRDGHRLTGTNFYFLDNQGGRSYYLGRLYYKSAKNKINGLFIELYSDVNVFQPGYSELLLDKKVPWICRTERLLFCQIY